MNRPPQNETEHWDRVIELAATADETLTADGVREIMGLTDEVMAEIDKKAINTFQKRQPNPNWPDEVMIDTVRAWELEIRTKSYAEELPGGISTERSRALHEAERALIRATTYDRRGDLTAMERVYRLYRALYKAYIATRKEQSDVR